MEVLEGVNILGGETGYWLEGNERDAFKTLAALAESKYLRRFDVHCTGYDPCLHEDPRETFDLVCGSSLECFTSRCNMHFNLTALGLVQLNLLASKFDNIRRIHCPALLRLHVSNCTFNDEHCAMLLECPMLQSLHVEQGVLRAALCRESMISDSGVKHLNSLKCLQKLVLVNQATVTPCFQLPQLVHLTLTGTPMTSRKLHGMDLECPCLEELCLSNNICKGFQAPVCKAAASCPHIRKLQLDRCDIILPQLVAAYSRHSVTHLNLVYSNLSGVHLGQWGSNYGSKKDRLAEFLKTQWGSAELVL
jgi:hypothetical protein